MIKIIFITGGVISSVGKGILAASIAAILKNSVSNIKIRKFDPYLNLDPGTLDPYEHGEVFVTEDGTETDLDVGHYERLGQVKFTKSDYCTTGQILQKIIKKERAGEYKGKTIQIFPHVINAIQESFIYNTNENDLLICEIGGTVGDLENAYFLHAAAKMSQKIECIFIHIGYIINLQSNEDIQNISAFSEDKTKPLQKSIDMLYSYGISPNIIACRGAQDKQYVLSKLKYLNYSQTILCLSEGKKQYIPYLYQNTKLGQEITKQLNIKYIPNLELKALNERMNTLNINKQLNIAIVTKYLNKDAHKSLIEAIKHAALYNMIKVQIYLIDSSSESLKNELSKIHGIIIPGGFGKRGIQGKMYAIRFADENNIPLLGICLGMQLLTITRIIDYTDLKYVNSQEFDSNATHQIFQLRSGEGRFGGKMLLGNQEIETFSILKDIYNNEQIIFKRCRNRYEFNIEYEKYLKQASLCIGAKTVNYETISCIGDLRKFFLGVQYHPELSSSLISPEPLFINFLKASSEYSL